MSAPAPQTDKPSADEMLRLAFDDTDDNWMQLHAYCEDHATAERFLRALQSAPVGHEESVVQWREAVRDLHPDLAANTITTASNG